MNIETNKKYIGNNDEMVEVLHVGETFLEYKKDSMFIFKKCVAFKDKKSAIHILIESDFIENYKLYKNESVEKIIERYSRDFSFKALVGEMLLDAKISLHLDFKEQILQLSSDQIDELLKK